MWLWFERDERDLPGIDFDYENSPVSAWRLSETGDEGDISDVPILIASRAAVKKVEALEILPWSQVPIVRARGLEVFQSLPSSEIQISPVEVRCADGVTDAFSMIRPKISAACTNLEKSSVDWVREGEFFIKWKRLEFLGGCMNGLSIAREKYSRRVVFSDSLKLNLEKCGASGMYFVRPEDSKNGYAPWVT